MIAHLRGQTNIGDRRLAAEARRPLLLIGDHILLEVLQGAPILLRKRLAMH